MEEGESPQRHQSPDNGFPTPGRAWPGRLPRRGTLESVGGLGDAIKHFLEGDLLDGKGQLEFGEVTEMGRGPGVDCPGVTGGYGGGETFLTAGGSDVGDHAPARGRESNRGWLHRRDRGHTDAGAEFAGAVKAGKVDRHRGGWS